MKKYISIVLAIVMVVCSLSGCGKNKEVNAASKEEATEGQIKIVTTIFPEYDWVKEILGDMAEAADITLLLDKGVDLHSYQPTADDIMKISTCDLFIYVGGESDEWVEDAFETATNKDMKVINLLDVLGDSVKAEEIVEGMQVEEHEHDGEEEHEHYGEEAHEYDEEEMDEHVWLSLRNAEILCKAISEALTEIDPDNKAIYEENVSKYISELASMDEAYQEMVNSSTYKTVLFGDRFPFRYLVDDYGLSYYAAFVGCSAESEASFETITFLSGKVDELGLNSVMTLEKSDKKIAKTIVENTQSKSQSIDELNSMQSTTMKDIENGATYISIMQKNLEVLEKVLK